MFADFRFVEPKPGVPVVVLDLVTEPEPDDVEGKTRCTMTECQAWLWLDSSTFPLVSSGTRGRSAGRACSRSTTSTPPMSASLGTPAPTCRRWGCDSVATAAECAVGRTAKRDRLPCPKPVVRTVSFPPIGETVFADIPLCAEHDREFEAYASTQGLQVSPRCAAGRYYRLARDDERFASWDTRCTEAGTVGVATGLDAGGGAHELMFCPRHFGDLQAAGVIREGPPGL